MQTLMNDFSVCMSTMSSELQNTRPTANTDSLDDHPICHIEQITKIIPTDNKLSLSFNNETMTLKNRIITSIAIATASLIVRRLIKQKEEKKKS